MMLMKEKLNKLVEKMEQKETIKQELNEDLDIIDQILVGKSVQFSPFFKKIQHQVII